MSANVMPIELFDRVRSICLSLPEATEKEAWGHPTFRVRDKIFTGLGSIADPTANTKTDNPAQTESVRLSMKSTPSDQAALLARGAPFFKPKYVGNKGWIGVTVDGSTDWQEVEELIMDSFCHVAPKKLTRLLFTDD